MTTDKFFRKSDWIACWATFAISLIVYTLTLQPTLGLEDSGELVVASDYLGVPHPPGYPIWSLLTWFFQWIFHGVKFHGHPNPAWGVNFFSAFAGAAACGALALLISRSGMDLLRSLKKESVMLGEDTESLFCAVAGIAGGLLLAFGQGMWSQAVIAEVYTFNIFFQSLVLVFLYRWMSRPAESKWLLLCAFAFGLGITNHQTLMFMGLAIAVAVLFNELEIFGRKYLGFILGAFAALILSLIGIYFGSLFIQILGIAVCIVCCLLIRHPFLVRDFIITGSMYIFLVGFNKWAATSPEHAKWMWVSGPEEAGFWIWTLYALLVPIIATFVLPKGKIVGPTFLVMFIGLGFYLYMPLSSDQNPPINWGYPRTWQGFMHAITRGQYERVKLAHVFTPRFLQQIGTYLMDLRSQFMWPIAILAAIPLAFGWKTGKKNIGWLVTTLVAFLSVGIIFMILQNPKTDIQTLFIARVQYIQSHAIFVIWLGYGILFLMAWLETLAKNNPITKVGGVVLVLLLPFSLIHKNKTNESQIKVVGGAEQNGHDFGWQFGNWQLEGVKGIKEDMRYWYPDDEEFEKQWAAYPCKDYPEPMGTNAIFFGGTDPGRFVPTYMIYSAHVRPDVYLITQNALADNTYMNVMRDLYGDQIWIPSPLDSNQAFQLYIQGIQNGTIQAGADVKTEDGKVQVQGVAGVMQINGFLSKMIFDHNQYRTETKTDEATRPVGAAVVHSDPPIGKDGKPPLRSFYVEESYVLPWMYPYLTPHGLIMKINNKPTQLTPEMIKNDTAFWNWYCNRLLNDEKFIRDIVARKSFSKLRSALAGLYAARGRVKESEAAFRQAVDLYDLSPEANFRLADLIAKQGRFDEAIALFDDFLEKDPNNEKGEEFRNGLKRMKEMTLRRQALEKKVQADFKANTFEFGDVRDLILIQFSSGMAHSGEALARQVIASNKLKPEELMALAQFMAEQHKYQTVELALKKYTAVQPKDPNGWLNLAGLQMVLNKRGEMYVSIKKAIDIGGETVRNRIRSDKRFDPVRNTEEFKKLVPPQANTNMGFSPIPGF
ncbi:protein O-mannosyl-transferase family [Pontiella sp.]|uniref:protein O-mannosyl-transferase family n=2 Tax=Pontiella sp. TaxID=2837462 RepID=UPI0035655A2F